MNELKLQTFSVKPEYGLTETIKTMNYLENLSLNQQDFVSWIFKKFSSDCSACLPGKIWKFVQENFEYKSDDPFDEFLTAPYAILKTKKGDCDDFSLFVKTCLDVLGGWHTHYILFAKEKNKYTHIAVFAHRGFIGNNYIDPVVIDGTNPHFNLISPIYNFYSII